MILQILIILLRNDVGYGIVEGYGNMFLCFSMCQYDEENNEWDHK